jgi:CDGSH-type Zn-finger protein
MLGLNETGGQAMTETTPKPTIAQKAPYPVQVEAGKSYWWCTCGNSAKQPFCDGTHKGGAFSPLKYTAEKDGQAWFCGCKASARAPLCDGRHKAL